MDSLDLISVIVPVYNVEKWLEQCLDSIINQTYKNIEIICINDCSPDNCDKILQKYQKIDSRITVIKNENNLGLGLTRNVGMKYAKGKWIHFVDSDDWLELDLYENLINKLNSLNFVPDLLFFNYKNYYEKNGSYKSVEFINTSILNKNLNPLADIEAFDNWDRYAWMKLHRREFMEENKIIFNNYPCMEDMEYAAQLYTKAKSICYTDINGINYRRREGSLVTQTSKFMDCKVKSFLFGKSLYEPLNENIKYKLLGFDYVQVYWDIANAYRLKYISLLDIISIVKKVNDKDTPKYIYDGKTLKELDYVVTIYSTIKRYFLYGYDNWFEKIFSIRNNICENKKHKIITILGFKIKVKQKQK